VSPARPSRATCARPSCLDRRRVRRAIAQRGVLDLQRIILVRYDDETFAVIPGFNFSSGLLTPMTVS
jgi:hypothetical protein